MPLAITQSTKTGSFLTETKGGKNIQIQNAVSQTSAAFVGLRNSALGRSIISRRSAGNGEGSNEGNGVQELHDGGLSSL